MATKQAALGSILKTDHNSDATFENMTLVSEITHPPRDRARVDAKDLGDALDVPLPGIENPSYCEFTQHWEPGDIEHEKLDTLFDSQTEFPVQIVTPHATPKTDEFNAKVFTLAPETLTPDGAYKRKVTLLRTSAITRT
jgi:hypothetical protein